MLESRRLMFGASSLWVALILLILVFRGGGAVPVEPIPEPPRLSLAQQAEELAALGDYMGAWSLLHQALQAAPEDVSLWYALGVTLSHVNQRKETEEAFQYVVRHGKPGSEEVRLARQWLVSAGVLHQPVEFAIAAEPVDVRGDRAAVTGKATWGEPERNRPPLRVQILLEGLNGAAEGKRFSTRVNLGQVYRLERLPGGSYHLVGGAAGHQLWDLTLDVEDGREVVLNLGKDNSTNASVALYQ